VTYLAEDEIVRGMAKRLRDLDDDALASLHRNASRLGRYAAESEMFRRIACKIPPTRVARRELAEEAA
jgi:hypothetical protein